MRAELPILVCAVLVLLCVVCEGTSAPPPPSSTSTNIKRAALACCSSPSSCSDAQKAVLRARAKILDEPDAQSTRDFVELALSGAACHESGGRSKRSLGDYFDLTCDSTPMDVQYGDVSLSCTLDVYLAAGIYVTDLYAYTYVGGSIYKSISGVSSFDYNASSTTYCQTWSLTFPRYSPSGNWTINSYAYNLGYTDGVYNSTVVTILNTINDNSPPVLTALGPSLVNLNDDKKFFFFSASDDLTGVTSAVMYFNNASNTIGYATWNSYGPQGNVGLLSVNNASFTNVYLYSGAAAGVYNIQIYVDDKIGFSSNYYLSTLTSAGLISTVTFDLNDCKAGTYRAYGTSGACSMCSAGMYSNDGAFKCNSCPPGTTSSVTGASSCTPCPAGTSGIGASWSCNPCAAGTYSPNAGRYFCITCPPGQNSSAVGATTCGSCPSGMRSSAGASQCTICPAGTYSNGYASYCTRCPAGTFSSSPGSSSCSPCPHGTFSASGETFCTKCRWPKTESDPGSTTVIECYSP